MSGWSVIAMAVALMIDGFFLFTAILRLILIADVKNDYTNPIEYAQRVNFLWYPEVGLYVVVTLLLAFFGPWWAILMHLPIIVYLVNIFVRRQHQVDPTRVLQGDTLKIQNQTAMIRLVFSVAWFFIYLYLIILDAISSFGQSRKVAFVPPLNT